MVLPIEKKKHSNIMNGYNNIKVMIFRLYTQMMDWIHQNPILTAYIAMVKGIIIGIIICQYLIK